ncbi:MAG: RNA polymerase sigma factor [Rubrivivax sp.]|nr:MAG: RNA polymerase sigma factor [Rubrivivax sp.]
MNAILSLDPRADDAELAGRIAAGDTAAFEGLMRRYNQRLYRLARVTLRHDGDAEDALQDAYLQAYRAMGSFRGDASLATWLSQLVMNECLNRLRKQARRDGIAPMVSADADDSDADDEAMDATPAEQPEDVLARAQLRRLIERKLDELPDSFAAVFVLRGIEELSVEETAHSLGIPEATVRSRYFRARGLLRQSLTQEIDLAQRDAFAFDGQRCQRIVTSVLDRMHNPGCP